jgi:hypothetical protein
MSADDTLVKVEGCDAILPLQAPSMILKLFIVLSIVSRAWSIMQSLLGVAVVIDG